jgi:DNA-binding MarR family transcriptional regulator
MLPAVHVRNGRGARHFQQRASHGRLRPDGQGANELMRDADGFYEALSTLIRYYQYRDRDRTCCQGLSVTEWYALDTIFRERVSSIGRIGRQLRMNKSTATRVVATLESRQLVQRHSSPTNHKVRNVSLTAKGRGLHAAIVARLTAEHRGLLAELSHDERVRVIEILRKLTALAARRVPLDG